MQTGHHCIQIFVNTVRATGSNNAQRWLSVPGRYTNIDAMTEEEIGFELPKDTVEHRIFASIHYYDWKFGMVETQEVTTFSETQLAELKTYFDKVVTRFTSRSPFVAERLITRWRRSPSCCIFL